MSAFFNLDIICQANEHRMIENVTVDNTITIRKLKQILLQRLRDLTEKIDFLNYGFIMHQNFEVCGHFLNNNILISSLDPDNFNGLTSGLMFMLKRSFRQLHLSFKDLNKRNKSLTLRRLFKKQSDIEKKFIAAIYNQNLIEIAEILKKDFDPNFNDDTKGLPPIFHAINVNIRIQENILDLLVTFGAHIDFIANNGNTIMHHAILLGNYTTITILLKYGSNINDVNLQGDPAWFYAINSDISIEFFRWILLMNPIYNTINDDTMNALHICCNKNLPTHLEILINTIYNQTCIEIFDKLINIQNQNGNTPLHIAVLSKSYECVKILKYYNVNLNIKNFAGETAMQISQRLNDFELISFLQLTNEQIISSNQTSSIVTCIPTSYSINTLKYNEIKEYYHPDQPNLLIDNDPNNIGIDFGFYQTNPYNKINTLKIKHKTNSYIRFATQTYPPIIQVIAGHSPLFCEQLQIFPGDMIQVFIILNSSTAFGRKKIKNNFEYGWFPSTCIGIGNFEIINKFKKTYFNKENFEKIKNLNKIQYYGMIPILKDLVISFKDFQFGLELSFKKDNFSSSILDSKNPILISPHYIKTVKENSIGKDYEFRIGDRIFAINGIDITNFNANQVSEIVKKILSQSKKNFQHKNNSNSNSSLKWFKKQSNDKNDKNNVNILIGRYHVPQIHFKQSLLVTSNSTISQNYSINHKENKQTFTNCKYYTLTKNPMSNNTSYKTKIYAASSKNQFYENSPNSFDILETETKQLLIEQPSITLKNYQNNKLTSSLNNNNSNDTTNLFSSINDKNNSKELSSTPTEIYSELSSNI